MPTNPTPPVRPAPKAPPAPKGKLPVSKQMPAAATTTPASLAAAPVASSQAPKTGQGTQLVFSKTELMKSPHFRKIFLAAGNTLPSESTTTVTNNNPEQKARFQEVLGIARAQREALPRAAVSAAAPAKKEVEAENIVFKLRFDIEASDETDIYVELGNNRRETNLDNCIMLIEHIETYRLDADPLKTAEEIDSKFTHFIDEVQQRMLNESKDLRKLITDLFAKHTELQQLAEQRREELRAKYEMNTNPAAVSLILSLNECRKERDFKSFIKNMQDLVLPTATSNSAMLNSAAFFNSRPAIEGWQISDRIARINDTFRIFQITETYPIFHLDWVLNTWCHEMLEKTQKAGINQKNLLDISTEIANIQVILEQRDDIDLIKNKIIDLTNEPSAFWSGKSVSGAKKAERLKEALLAIPLKDRARAYDHPTIQAILNEPRHLFGKTPTPLKPK